MKKTTKRSSKVKGLLIAPLEETKLHSMGQIWKV